MSTWSVFRGAIDRNSHVARVPTNTRCIPTARDYARAARCVQLRATSFRFRVVLFSFFFFFSFSWSWSQFSIYRYTRSIDKFYCTKKVYESRLAWVDERVTRFAWRLFESILIRNVRIRNELIWKNSKDHICNVYFTYTWSLSNRLINLYTRTIGNRVRFLK